MYEEAAPPRRLSGVARCVWRSASEGPKRIVPDGCVDLVRGEGAVFVAGPDTAAWSSVTRPGEVLSGVRLIPGLAAAVLGVAADEVRDRRVPLAELWGRCSAERLAEGEVSLVAEVAERLSEAPPPDEVDAAVAELIARLDKGAARVGDAAAELSRAGVGGAGARGAAAGGVLFGGAVADGAPFGGAGRGIPAPLGSEGAQSSLAPPSAATSGGPTFGEAAFGEATSGRAAFGGPEFGAATSGGPAFGRPVFGRPVFGAAASGTAAFGEAAFSAATSGGAASGGATSGGSGPADLVAARVEDPALPAAVSERRLRRRFVQAVGYGPATYLRVSRFQRAVALAPRAPNLAALAAAAGYADQAHLSRDCRALTGLTPRAYFR
ncbi:helix-turn-helix domain-containing protein [Amycolatopsis sp.]|uniref:helix-turn-helix domain-containing protein n=1 Tax=Amycolatopsis sp. TaxID=37632 RepID=UPI002D7FC841|nr:helix-turn-helix domain-containing protein [Amycolatopsis sp.]HET6710106.1 helix-turn-helix domain-containing protein [Amycolatopsis sp.]